MRIAIINLTAGGISGGYKKYLLNILPLLNNSDRVSAVLCALPRGMNGTSWFDEKLNKIQFTQCRPYSPFWFQDGNLKKQLDIFHPDIIFVPVEKPFNYAGVKRISMLQNMAPMVNNYNKGSLTEIIRMKLRLYQAKKAMISADYVIAPSDFVKNYITEQWHVAQNKISTIYFGADTFEPVVQKPERFAGLPSRSVRLNITAGLKTL